MQEVIAVEQIMFQAFSPSVNQRQFGARRSAVACAASAMRSVRRRMIDGVIAVPGSNR
jgi:hypothetical protein